MAAEALEPVTVVGEGSSAEQVQSAIVGEDDLTWFGQPRGLVVLMFTNMWEQFSYYGMRALLVYYMTRQLMFSQIHASFVYGAYTACAYFTPILGGAVADRYLGKRRAVVLGGCIMAVGHFMMTFEPLVYVALATIALGNGLFLPTLPSQINDLYRVGDPRRSWAYNVYYVGINIGGFLAPLICGTLGELYGWHYGFGAAGLGMIAGLAVYVRGQRYLPPEQKRIEAETARAPAADSRRIVLALAAVGLSVTIFRAAYEQLGNTVALWADSGVDRRLGGFTIPMTWFQALDPLLVMLLTPTLLAMWRRRADTSPARRMAQGALITALAYVFLAAVAWHADGARASWPWLVLFVLIFTVGELFILPTGLGLFARLAPPRMGATTVAAWYFAIFTGSLAAGLVGSLWSLMGRDAYFSLLAAIATIAALLLRLLDPLVCRIDPNWVGR